MPYFLITDFKQGLDARRSPSTVEAGALLYANNVHVTRGGELEKRKAFVPVAQLPPGSVGLAACKTYLLVYSDHAATPPVPWILWVATPGVTPTYMLDTTRWRDQAVTTLETTDPNFRLLMIEDQRIDTWAYDTTNKPVAVEAFRGKVYGAAGSMMFGSALYDPKTWDPNATGSFATDCGMESAAMSQITAVSVFQGSLVLLAADGLQVWDVDPDPAKNTLTRSLINTGSIAPRSVLNFGNFDTVFLAKSGIRSLQVRQATDIMNVQDIGTPIDDLVGTLIAQVGSPSIARVCMAAVEPEGARLWVAFGDVILVNSYYQGSSIAAWTTYTPGFPVDGLIAWQDRIYVRSGDTIYEYGGPDGTAYDNSLAEVQMPYLDAQKPATAKAFTGFDLGCSGQWEVKVGLDPTQTDVLEYVGIVTDDTWAEPSQSLVGYSTHCSLYVSSSDAGPVRVTSAAIHYDEGEAT